MADDVFDELEKVDVPPVPEDFARQIHHRLNTRLLTVHLLDLALRGLPYALFHFVRALTSLVVYSLVGRYDVKRRSRQ